MPAGKTPVVLSCLLSLSFGAMHAVLQTNPPKNIRGVFGCLSRARGSKLEAKPQPLALYTQAGVTALLPTPSHPRHSGGAGTLVDAKAVTSAAWPSPSCPSTHQWGRREVSQCFPNRQQQLA